MEENEETEAARSSDQKLRRFRENETRMKRHLFLSGPVFSGKSRLIRELLGRGMQSAGGFCTELCASSDGTVFGCAMMPTAMAGGVEGLEKELFLNMKSFPPTHDSEVFRNLGVRLLEESAWYPYAVLDEIGGIDLIIPQFRVALDGLLASELPILGVVKTREDSERMRQLLGLGTRYTAFSERLYGLLTQDPDTEILRISENAEKEAGEPVRAWVAEYASLPGF